MLTLATTIINILPRAENVKNLTAVFSALAGVSAFSSEGVILGFTGKNKSKFIKQIKKEETKLNRVYLFYEKARSDAVISNEELAEFFALLSDTPSKQKVSL